MKETADMELDLIIILSMTVNVTANFGQTCTSAQRVAYSFSLTLVSLSYLI